MKHAASSEFENAQISLPFPVRTDHPTQAELQEFFSYDPTTGSFINKVNRGAAKAGMEAGYDHSMRSNYKNKKYRRVSFKGKRYLVHVLIAVMMFGGIAPGLEIDHRDGNPSNNAIHNIRPVTHSLNMLNTDKHRAKA